jgi:hypothetical protein
MNDKPKETNLWSFEAMQNDPDWEELRKIAKNALSSFGVSVASPKLDWLVYIKSKRPNT